MSLIAKILYPVNFSPSCVAMAPYVKRAAALLGATVSLVHVVDPALHSGFEVFELYARPLSEISEENLRIGRGRLDSFLATDFPVETCARILASGDPATQIAHVAREIKADLIIMPTHAGLFRQTLLGSTTAKVLNDADCPVLTSRHALEIAPRPLEHREWVCAVGLSSNSERVLRFAVEAAAQARGKVSIVYAVQGGDPDLPVQLDLREQINAAEIREAKRRIDELARKVGTDVTVRIAVGSVKEALLEAVRNADADALLIGRSLQSGVRGRLRDLTYAVVRDSPFPVLSI